MSDGENTDVKVSITKYTEQIVKIAVTEAMKQHQDTCPLSKVVSDLSLDMWGTNAIPGIKKKVEKLDDDLKQRKENVSFIKRPFFNGLVGAFFVCIGICIKDLWQWIVNRT